jgi:hypothetical protein
MYVLVDLYTLANDSSVFNLPAGLASRVSLFLLEMPQERATDVVEYGLMAAPRDLSPNEMSPIGMCGPFV